MTIISVPQNSFVGGEWAPSLYARPELAKYSTATRLMRNAYPHPHGPVSNRGGTLFIAATKDSTKASRLVPFQFSVVQSYVLEFGHYYMRVYKDGGPVVMSVNPPDAYNAGTTYDHGDYVLYGGANHFSIADGNTGRTPGVNPAWWHTLTDDIVEISTPYREEELALLKFTQSADVLKITHPNYPSANLTRTAHDVWLLNAISFGTVLDAPENVAIAGGSGHFYTVTAVDEYGRESLIGGIVQGAPGNILSWDAVTGADYYNVYRDSNLGGFMGWIARASSTSSFKDPSADILPDYTTAPKTAKDPLSGADNYPGVSTFFQQRWVAARTNNAPQTLFGSILGEYENFNESNPLLDSDAYEFTINSNQVNEIRHLVPLKELLIFTSATEWKMSSGNQVGSITPSSVDLKKVSNYGCSNVPPMVIANAVLFIEGSGQVVRDFQYEQGVENYSAVDLSILANHLFRDYEIVSWCYQQNPDSIIWCVRNDGALIGLTYYKEHEVWGWHRHDTEGGNLAFFESVTCIRTAAGVDEVYVIVKRLIDGTEKRYVEKFMPRLPRDENTFETNIDDAFFVDCGLTYDGWNQGPSYTSYVMTLTTAGGWTTDEDLTLTTSGWVGNFTIDTVGKYYKLKIQDTDRDSETYKQWFSVILLVTGYTSPTVVTVRAYNRPVPTLLQGESTYDWALMATTISGLDHLEDKDVVALGDGNVIKDLTVASGEVELSNPVAKIHIGLPYTSEVETLDFEYPTGSGTAQDKIRESKSVVVRMENTRALWVGPDKDETPDEIAFREDEDYGEPTELFTGSKEIPIKSADEPRQGRVYLYNEDPVPFTILSLITRMDTEEGEGDEA